MLTPIVGSSFDRLVCILAFCLFCSGCGGPYLRIDDPVEPFSVSQSIANSIKVEVEVKQTNHLSSLFEESFGQTLGQTLVKGGIVRTISPVSLSQKDGGTHTLRIIANLNFDPSTGFLIVKAVFFSILFPLFPFMQHTFTYEATADYSIVSGGSSTQTTLAKSNLHITRTFFARPFNAEEAMPFIAEDLSWKIALELKRHPDWLQMPKPSPSP